MVNKIIDCFSFFNEIKMLKFRLEYLYDCVDYFVIVEANLSHSGNSKEMYYENNKALFEKYKDKIIHVIVEDMPTLEETSDAWVRERFQRNAIHRGILKINDINNLNDNDLIIVSDCDEIPDKNYIIRFKNSTENFNNHKFSLLQDLYYYNLNCKFRNPWHQGTQIVNYYTYKNVCLNSPQSVRFCQAPIKFIPLNKGGWHFSYYGDVDFIINKLKNFAHQEYNNDDFINPEQFKKCIDNNIRIFDTFELNESGCHYVAIENNDYLPENYKMLI